MYKWAANTYVSQTTITLFIYIYMYTYIYMQTVVYFPMKVTLKVIDDLSI